MNDNNKRDNSGIFFVNNRKQTASHSDFQGTITVEGVEYYLNIWTKNGAKGEFWTCTVKRKGQPADTGTKKVYTAGTSSMSKARATDPDDDFGLDDKIPF